MKLYIMQHGQSCSKAQNPERPLTERGFAEVGAMAEFLKRVAFSCQRVIHSGKLRARQTAELMLQTLELNVPVDVSDIINPQDDPQAFAWQSGSWDRDTLVVGHLPFMAKLASHLMLGDESKLHAEFTPGAIMCLERNNEDNWRLLWMIRPDMVFQGEWAATQLP